MKAYSHQIARPAVVRNSFKLAECLVQGVALFSRVMNKVRQV